MNKKYAVDTNVILDILTDDLNFKDESKEKLYKMSIKNKLVINEIVYSELLIFFESTEKLNVFLKDTNISFEHSTKNSIVSSSIAWKKYLKRRTNIFICQHCGNNFRIKCSKCGQIVLIKQHILTDFLIGGFAISETNGLITRDEGYYKTYFPKLKLI